MAIIATFNDGYDDTGGPDDVIGTGGYDTVLFQVDNNNAYTIDSRVFDMRITNFISIEEIQLSEINPLNGVQADLQVELSGDQIGAGLSANLHIIGDIDSANSEAILIFMDTSTTLDISGWTFTDWGNETIYIYGDADAETFTGSSEQDYIDGGAGDDTFRYLDGQDGIPYYGDTFKGGAGNDTLLLVLNATATDTLFDLRELTLQSLEQITFSSAGGLDATLLLSASQAAWDLPANMHVTGSNAPGQTEAIELEMGAVTTLDLSGWTFADWGSQGERITITGDSDAETITASAGRDFVHGLAGDDQLHGGGGTDDLYGGSGFDQLFGDAGNDWIYGSFGNDTLFGGDGNDGMYGHAGDDTLMGEGGDDVLFGNDGADNLAGGPGDDVLRGHADNDILEGGDGNDVLYGGAGDDVLIGGAGDDVLYGGIGLEVMVFDAGWGTDTVHGFADGQDVFDLVSLGITFADLTITAVGGDTHISYNGDTIIVVGVDPSLIDYSDFTF
ncbi:MAG TPA: calcium-binding protein [Thermopetrobacter sp.]|nr:calcium-binding protein [Thermopetrobacter sp.]